MLNGIGTISKEIYKPRAGLSIQVVVYAEPYEYKGNWYNPVSERVKDNNRIVNIKTKDFLVFNYVNQDIFVSIHMGYKNVYVLSKALNKALKYFDNKLYPGLFYRDDESLKINKIDYPKTGIKISHLGGDKSIFIYPDIVDDGKGIVMLLNDQDNVIEFTQNDFTGLTWVIDHLDLTSVATNLLTFASIMERKTANPNLKRVGGR